VKARQYGSKTITQKDATSQLMMLLVSARSIDGFTHDYLARTYRVTPQKAKAMLEAEKLRRAR